MYKYINKLFKSQRNDELLAPVRLPVLPYRCKHELRSSTTLPCNLISLPIDSKTAPPFL